MINPKTSEYRKIDFEGDNLPAYFECAYCRHITNKGALFPLGNNKGSYYFACSDCLNDEDQRGRKE